MNLPDLVLAALQGDDLIARQWVKDAERARLQLTDLPMPEGLNNNGLVVAAALVDLLAQRWNQPPPPWVSFVGRASERIYLLPQAQTSPALRRWCEEDSPEPLRARNVFAVQDYLKVA